jgi:hypothetical protein
VAPTALERTLFNFVDQEKLTRKEHEEEKAGAQEQG